MNKITTELKEFVSTMPCAFALLEPIKVSTEEVIDFLIIYNNQKFITEINLQDKQPNDIRLSRLLFDDSGELIKTCLRVYKNGESENIIAPVGKENEVFEIGISFLQETISICLNKKHSSIKNEEFVTKENVFHNKLKQDSSLRKTLDNMPEGCAIISFDWIYLYVNETNAKHSHLTVNDMLGKNIHDVLPGIEKSDFYSRLKKCMELRELQHIEAEYIFPDGEIGWYEGIVQPVPDGIFILSIDITERKLAEKKQKKAENLYQTLFNSIDEGFCIVNVILNKNNEPVDYVFEEANHAFERQTGGVNIKGKKIQEMSYKHKEDWFRIFRNVIKTGESARFQERLDQQEKWYDVYAFPIGLPGELKIGILINDVTAHKHAEEVLIENQKLLQSTMDNLPTAIVYKDIEGRYINFNKVVEKVLGRKKEEIIGLTDFNLFPSEYAEKYRQNDLEVIRTGEPVQREEETILPDGKFYYMDISFPLKDFRGKIYGVGHISYDITEIRKINEELGKKQEILSLILEHINEGIIVSNAPDGKVIAISRWGINHTLGRSVDAVIDLPLEKYLEQWDVRDIKTGEKTEPQKLPVYRALQGEIIQGEEWLMVRPDGSTFITSVNSVPIYNNTGDTVISAVATWVDITSRKKAEDELRINEAAMQAFFDASPGILNLFDKELRFLKCDPITPAYFNLDGQSIIGKSVDELNPQFAKTYLRPMMNRVVSSGKPEINSLVKGPVPARGGKTGYWHVSYFPVPLSNEETGLGVMGIEITEIKHATEAVRESEAKLLQAQKLGRFGNYTFDLRNNTIEWSDELYNIWEVDKNKPIPSFETLWKQLHPDDREKIKKDVGEAVREKDRVDTELRIVFPDNRIKYIRVIANMLYDEAGNPVKRQGVVIDITDTKIVQLKLEEAYSQISDRLQEKEVLIRELYHRTKNNMQVISSLLGLNAMRFPDLEVVFNDLQNRIKAISLVHEKLYKSQNLSRINLKEYISELIAFLRISHSVSEEKIKYKCELEDVLVLIDIAVPCGLIVTELIINSMKYAFPGGKTGYIEIKLKVLTGNIIRLVIADNGIGFNREDLNSENKIGLKLFKSIVENQLDGTVEINTEHGTSWIIEFKDSLYYERV